MTKEQLKQWPKYKKSVERRNKQAFCEWGKVIDDLIDERLNSYKEYDDLPWYVKPFTANPYFLFSPLPSPLNKEPVSMEGFMDYLTAQ